MNMLNDEIMKKELGNRLKNAIKVNKLTQDAFAHECEITYQTLRKYLKGDSYYKADFLIRASKILNVTTDYLLCLDNTEPCLPDEKSFITKIENATHLSADASAQLLNMGLHKKSKEFHIYCIELLLEEPSILEKLARYFKYIENRNLVHESQVQNKEDWEYAKKPIDHVVKYPNDLELIDIDNILLYQFMKSIDVTVKRKILDKNKKRRV